MLLVMAKFLSFFFFFTSTSFAFYRDSAIYISQSTESVTSSIIDHAGKYGYFTLDSSLPTIVKVRLKDLIIEGTLSLGVGDTMPVAILIDLLDKYLYLGTRTCPGKIIKINLDNFVKEATLSLNSDEAYVRTGFIDENGLYAYFGTGWKYDANYSPKLVKVNLSNFTRVESIATNNGQGDFVMSLFNPALNRAYLISEEGTITAFSLMPFKRSTVLGPEVSGCYPKFAFKTGDGTDFIGYFGCRRYYGQTQLILQFNWVGNVFSVYEYPGNKYLEAGCYDSRTRYLYTNYNDDMIARISLPVFSDIQTIKLVGSDSTPSTCIIDENSGYMYFGTQTYGIVRSQVIKIGINPRENVTGKLDKAYAYPTPFNIKSGHTVITFVNLLPNTKIKIFTLSGEFVSELNSGANTFAYWNVKNSTGGELSPGTYLVKVSVNGETKTFKIMIMAGK